MSAIAIAVGAAAVIGSQFLTKKPKIPGFEPVNAQDEQLKAIKGNEAALPAAEKLASGVNQFNQDEILKQLRTLIPSFDTLLADTGKNIQAQLKGEIPDDVSGQIFRGNVAKGLETGTGGSSPRTSNVTARDLGLTSLALKDKGFDSLNRWIGTARTQLSAPQFDVTSMFLTPATQLAFAVDERNSKFQRNMVSNQNDAYYSTGSRLGRGLSQAGGALMGGGLGGGGGGGGGGGAPSGYISYPGQAGYNTQAANLYVPPPTWVSSPGYSGTSVYGP